MTEYDKLIKDLKKAPMTWIPALLKCLIEQAVEKKVFVKGGLKVFVENTLEQTKDG